MKYTKISKEEVFDLMIRLRLDWMNPIEGLISLVNMAYLLNTSRYQVKKYIDELVAEGLVQLDMVILSTYGEEYEYPTAPYWGYRLTEKAIQTDKYKEMDEEADRKYIESVEERNKSTSRVE